MISIIKEAILDGMVDTLKLIPFLFLTYLVMEYLEDRMQDKTKAVLKKTGKSGPLWGAFLGVIPQCGFSAAASSLYAGRMLTMGTLIAIFLSTSDEMLPIMISEAVAPSLIMRILVTKLFLGIVVGYIVDILYRCFKKKSEPEVDIHHFCEHENCQCGQGILRPAIRHTLQIALFILIVTLVLNIFIGVFGVERLASFVLNKPVLGQVLSGMIGLIPNCAASVVITELYLNGAMSFGTMIAGLLVGAGVGILVLFRVNDNKKENFIIVSILYISGVLAGLLIDMIGFI